MSISMFIVMLMLMQHEHDHDCYFLQALKNKIFDIIFIYEKVKNYVCLAFTESCNKKNRGCMLKPGKVLHIGVAIITEPQQSLQSMRPPLFPCSRCYNTFVLQPSRPPLSSSSCGHLRSPIHEVALSFSRRGHPCSSVHK